jgi:hypothetical protein
MLLLENDSGNIQLSRSLPRSAQPLGAWLSARLSYIGVPQDTCVYDYIIYLEVADAHELADEFLRWSWSVAVQTAPLT